jgi:hypothetical protein
MSFAAPCGTAPGTLEGPVALPRFQAEPPHNARTASGSSRTREKFPGIRRLARVYSEWPHPSNAVIGTCGPASSIACGITDVSRGKYLKTKDRHSYSWSVRSKLPLAGLDQPRHARSTQWPAADGSRG